jgi:Domain of unknown function (DUF932)
MLNASARPEHGLAPALKPHPDQDQRWYTHDRTLAFDEAALLVTRAHEADGIRYDLPAPDLRAWAFGSASEGVMQLVPVPLPGAKLTRPLALREHAFGQLCQKLDAPAAYVRELPAKLQMACVNWALTQRQQGALLRVAGDEIRAVVSERYAPIDDALLLEVMDGVLGDAGYRADARVRATATGPHTVLRVTIPSASVAVAAGDVIEFGVDLANSELGLRSVQVTPITHRLVCSNGMRAWKSEAGLRLRHIGDPIRLRTQLREALPVALAEARGDLERWKRATHVLIDDALEEIDNLRLYGLSSHESNAIVREYAKSEGVDLATANNEALTKAASTRTTAFALANAITATARERSDVTARLSLESVAHRYLARKAG